jgi:hypothetical protein
METAMLLKNMVTWIWNHYIKNGWLVNIYLFKLTYEFKAASIGLLGKGKDLEIPVVDSL